MSQRQRKKLIVSNNFTVLKKAQVKVVKDTKTQINVEKNNGCYPQISKLFTVKITKGSGLRNSLFSCICSIIMAFRLTGVINMKDTSPIQSSWFYMHEIEKCKFNWFLYEYACTLYAHIRSSGKETLLRWRSKRTNKQLAWFCAYFSKRMRQDIFAQLEGRTDGIIYVDEDIVQDYGHEDTSEDVAALQEAAKLAWDELLEICEICPEQCIVEWDEPTEYFDRE